MLYSTPEFFVFLALITLAYHAVSRPALRHGILLAGSLFFYAWASAFDALVFSFVVGISWAAARIGANRPGGRGWIYAGIAVLTAHLFLWKYANWVIDLARTASPGFLEGWDARIPLPIGISFFTLQGIAYLVDLSRGKAPLMRLKDYLLFKSFFAQLVAGPIVRSSQLLPQLQALRRSGPADWIDGLTLLSCGLTKKLAVADRISPFVDEVFQSPAGFGRWTLVKAAIAYTVQIWADFSGYTDMGRGAARLLGIRLPENFFGPYLATTPSEFWKRWHVTLSQWIRDYIYIPLGGNRVSLARHGANLMFTMSLAGLWHGARANFIVWGAYHGALLLAERALSPLGSRLQAFPGARRLASPASWLLTQLGIVFGWIVFRAESWGQLADFAKGLAAPPAVSAPAQNGSYLAFALLACIAFHLASAPRLGDYRERALARIAGARRVGVPLAIALGAAVGVLALSGLFLRPKMAGSPFIYFQF